ncbi:MAG TPA: WGR domain-containing protein [Enhygromyxa sp.]|nr:WGR domain-containing protein [Enhygromyxa sp.]
MPVRRFEFKDSRSYKFWEIEIEGTAFTVRYGKVGTDGVTQTKSYASADKAAAEAQKKITEKVRKGYAEVGSVAPVRKQATEADSTADWSVRADELQAAGDPWGQRIALWIAREAASTNKKRALTKEIVALDSEHRDHFYGPALAELLEDAKFAEVARLTWEYGYITRARVGMPEYGFKGPKAKEVLRAIVQSPAAKHLRELTIGLYDFEGGGLTGVGSDIASGGTLAHLEKLFIGDFHFEQQEISWVSHGDLSPLYAVTPKLATLRLHGAGMILGELEHPTLARLEIETGGLPRESVVSLANAKLPELVHLEVWFGRRDYGGTNDITALRPIFTTKTLPKLRHLGLQNAEIQDEIAAELANSPLLAQVESVDLSMGTMREPGARALLANAASYKHLKSLNLERNYIPADLASQLTSAFGSMVKLGRQGTPDVYDGENHYYTSVGE